MASHNSFWPIGRLIILRGSGVRRASRGAGQTSCGEEGRAGRPPCPPCPCPAPPACRGAPSASRLGLRVTCRPPAPRPAPPCLSTDLITCANAHTKSNDSKTTACPPQFSGGVKTKGSCGYEVDRVAQRLAAAKAVRRAHYEREVAARAPCPAPPPALYPLPPGRECVRATDGCDYTVSGPCSTKPSCPCNQEPPPPRLVELAPTDGCEIRHGKYLDPCAHRPKILLEIDRSCTNIQSGESIIPASVPAPSAPCDKQPPKKLSKRERITSRIMETLNLKRDTKSPHPRQPCSSNITKDSTGRMSMDSWCSNPPKPVAVAPRCREPTIVEQLRRRPGATISRHCNNIGKATRKIHTSTLCATQRKGCTATGAPLPCQAKNKEGDLENVSGDRSQLKEAAQGRVVRPEGAGAPAAAPGAGQLELRIPPASESVRVRVSLDFVGLPTPSCLLPTAVVPVAGFDACKHANSRTLSSTFQNTESWLSIKNLQKKLSEYRKNEQSPTDMKSKTELKCPKDAPKQQKSSPECGCIAHKKKIPPKDKRKESPCGCYPNVDPRRCSSALELTPTYISSIKS